jgi:hypothetical protein
VESNCKRITGILGFLFFSHYIGILCRHKNLHFPLFVPIILRSKSNKKTLILGESIGERMTRKALEDKQICKFFDGSLFCGVRFASQGVGSIYQRKKSFGAKNESRQSGRHGYRHVISSSGLFTTSAIIYPLSSWHFSLTYHLDLFTPTCRK